MSLYLLSQPSGEFASLVSPLLTPETIPNTALVILLDWAQPHLWLRQIWSWIQVLEEVMGHTSPEARSEMEETMSSWRERGRGGSSTNLDGTPSATAADSDGSLPLGPGEWSEPLGLPLCVVCQNVSCICFAGPLHSADSHAGPENRFSRKKPRLERARFRHGSPVLEDRAAAPYV